MTPSVQAMEVNPWPGPAALARCPLAAACFTRSTSSASVVGRRISTGAHTWLRPQLVQLARSLRRVVAPPRGGAHMARPARTRESPLAPGAAARYAFAMKWRRTRSDHVDDLRGAGGIGGGMGVPLAAGGGLIGIIVLLIAVLRG